MPREPGDSSKNPKLLQYWGRICAFLNVHLANQPHESARRPANQVTNQSIPCRYSQAVMHGSFLFTNWVPPLISPTSGWLSLDANSNAIMVTIVIWLVVTTAFRTPPTRSIYYAHGVILTRMFQSPVSTLSLRRCARDTFTRMGLARNYPQPSGGLVRQSVTQYTFAC